MRISDWSSDVCSSDLLLAGTGGMLPASLVSCIGGSNSKGSQQSADSLVTGDANADLFFKISLAEWSLHRALRGGKLDNLDFPAKAKNEFGIDAVEFVNQFFMDKAGDQAYLTELKQRCQDLGVTSVRIMIDEEGDLGNTEDRKSTRL